jgi:serine/threonine protein kinase
VEKANKKIKAHRASLLSKFKQTPPHGFNISDFPDEYALNISDIKNIIRTHKSIVVVEPPMYDRASVLTRTRDEIVNKLFITKGDDVVTTGFENYRWIFVNTQFLNWLDAQTKRTKTMSSPSLQRQSASATSQSAKASSQSASASASATSQSASASATSQASARFRRNPSILGQGTYGCVLTEPLLKCDPKKPTHTFSNKPQGEQVTKLFSDSTDYDQEVGIYSRIANIDPDDKYFVKAVKGCYARPKKIKTHPADPIQKCKMLQNYAKAPLPQIIMPFAGINLLDYLVAKRRIDFDEWLPHAINLVEAISVLRDHEICHLDIKADNIMFHNNTTLLTDFGLSTSFENMYVPKSKQVPHGNAMYENALFSTHVMWPPEIHWHEYKYKPTRIGSYFMSKFTNIYAPRYISTFYTGTDIKNAATAMNTLIQNNVYTDIERIFNDPKNIAKIDLFSLGMTFIYLHDAIDFSKSSKTTKYMDIVRKMADFDYTKRCSVDDALNALKAL